MSTFKQTAYLENSSVIFACGFWLIALLPEFFL